MRQAIYDIIQTTAAVRAVPMTPELIAICEYELEKSPTDDVGVIGALEAAFIRHMKERQ